MKLDLVTSAHHMGESLLGLHLFPATLSPKLGQKWEKEKSSMNLTANTRTSSQHIHKQFIECSCQEKLNPVLTWEEMLIIHKNMETYK